MASVNRVVNAAIPSGGVLAMHKLLDEMRQDVANLKAQVDQLKADHDSHTHQGVTAGVDASGAPSAASTADAVTLQVEP